MPTRPIALVPEVGMDPTELARVAAALQKQVTRDLGPLWEVSGTVDAFPRLEDVPAGYWPIIVTFRKLGDDEGIHLDRNGQPYALVELAPGWSLAASHICLELLTNPAGTRTFPGPSPRAQQGEVEFLGGVCDPCEHPDYAYVINDVLVSDFCTPAYWDTTASNRDRLSFTGAVQSRHEVLNGGHLSWYDPVENAWWLRRNTDGSLSDVKVGVFDPRRGTVREFIRGRVPHLLSTKMTAEAFEARTGAHRQRALRASTARAFWLRAKLANEPGVDKMQFEEIVRASLNLPHALPGGDGLADDRVVDLSQDDRGDAKTTLIRANTLERHVDEALETAIHVPRSSASPRPAAGSPPPGWPSVAPASPRRSAPPPLPSVMPPPSAHVTSRSVSDASIRGTRASATPHSARNTSIPPPPPGAHVPRSFVLGAVAVTIMAGVIATVVGLRVGQHSAEGVTNAVATSEGEGARAAANTAASSSVAANQAMALTQLPAGPSAGSGSTAAVPSATSPTNAAPSGLPTGPGQPGPTTVPAVAPAQTASGGPASSPAHDAPAERDERPTAQTPPAPRSVASPTSGGATASPKSGGSGAAPKPAIDRGERSSPADAIDSLVDGRR